ncbi:MAG: DUF4257 domain-containing protein [bacterium]|nr:DUF4257 domain-containing protein [bacterium]
MMDSVNLWIVISGGAFGGLLHALYLNENKLLLPTLRRNGRIYINLGFVGDILLGIGAGLAILLFIAPDTMAKQIGLSIVSGFSGGALLGSLMNKLATELEKKKVDKLEKLLEDYNKNLEKIQQELKKKEGGK